MGVLQGAGIEEADEELEGGVFVVGEAVALRAGGFELFIVENAAKEGGVVA